MPRYQVAILYYEKSQKQNYKSIKICQVHHVTAGTYESVPANGDLQLLFIAQLYV